MKRLSQTLLLTSLFTVATSAYAEKIGVVNLDEVLLKSPLAMSLNDKMSKEYKPRQDAVNTAQRKLQSNLDVLNYTGYKMSNKDRTALQESINKDRRELERLSVSLQTDLANSQVQNTQLLMSKLSEVVNKIAQDGKYDVIQTTANLLYINTAIDLTPQVINQLK